MDRKTRAGNKRHTTASLSSLYGSEQELPFESRHNDIEARLLQYSNGFSKVVDRMRNKNSAAHARSPHLDPNTQLDSTLLAHSRNHLQRNCSIAPSCKEDYSMLLSPKVLPTQDRLASKFCFGSTAAISNEGTTTIIDRQSSKATDQELASGRDKNRLNNTAQLTSGSILSAQDPEEAGILKAGGFGSLKEAFECQARMVVSSDAERHARDQQNHPTGTRAQESKVVPGEQVQPAVRKGLESLPRALRELNGQGQTLN
jgi:hypothetical protein